jgi:hypothetical protein
VTKLKLVTISDTAFQYYKRKVRNNKDITYDLSRRKLTRNILLAKKIPARNEEEIQKGNELYIYGNLYILKRGNRVIHLWNHKNTNAIADWEVDEAKRADLSRELGIID